TLTYDTLRFSDTPDFPETAEPVWILGKKYSALTEKEELLNDVTSRLWFTYRRNFPAIGGTGPTSDTGWGCMLRCGQMIFAQALICRHIGREWRWDKKGATGEYLRILTAFLDKKDSYYSIHQIAQMGVGEGKYIGQWYGPNTVAQVLSCDSGPLCNGYAGAPDSHRLWKPLVLLIPLRLGLSEINEAYIETLKVFLLLYIYFIEKQNLMLTSGFARKAFSAESSRNTQTLSAVVYYCLFQHCFMLPQSLGVIGGRPNSAHYFIGYVGDELIYLDPHTTQPAVEPSDGTYIQDDSFHCQHPPCRMHVSEIDPSIAVGFICNSEEDFDDWCQHIRKVSTTLSSKT
ncbi:hypothetical protein GDO81_024391, partial [Engystomops pustulosus]